MSIVEFLLARIGDDELIARETADAFPEPYEVADRGHMARLYWNGADFPTMKVEQDETPNGDGDPGAPLHHLARFGPARVRRECAAKRELLDMADPYDFADDGGTGMSVHAHRIHRILAAVYADHPDYDEAWRP